MMYEDEDSRVLGVLSRALHSTSRFTRLRAVSMLAFVECPERMNWLEDACADDDGDVAAAACAVVSWVIDPPDPPWPQREDPRFDALGDATQTSPVREIHCAQPGKWEYVVEVWRDDGLLLGAYLATTCEEDDEHARRIALGQAILANSGGKGDAFDAARAASFIVAKRSLLGHLEEQGHRGGD